MPCENKDSIKILILRIKKKIKKSIFLSIARLAIEKIPFESYTPAIMYK